MDSIIRKRTPQPEFLREFLWKYQVRFDNMRKQIFLEFTKHGYINPAQAKPSSPATFHFKTFEHRLELEFKTQNITEAARGSARVIELESFCARQILC